MSPPRGETVFFEEEGAPRWVRLEIPARDMVASVLGDARRWRRRMGMEHYGIAADEGRPDPFAATSTLYPHSLVLTKEGLRKSGIFLSMSGAR